MDFGKLSSNGRTKGLLFCSKTCAVVCSSEFDKVCSIMFEETSEEEFKFVFFEFAGDPEALEFLDLKIKNYKLFFY